MDKEIIEVFREISEVEIYLLRTDQRYDAMEIIKAAELKRIRKAIKEFDETFSRVMYDVGIDI